MGTKTEPYCSGSFCECIDGRQSWYSVRFLRTDGGRAQSKRPKQSNDCTVRAVALAFAMPYDEAYELMAAAGRKCGQGHRTWKVWTRHHPRLRWISFPAVKGRPRMNPAKFCSTHPAGRYIAQTAKHVTAVIDGVWMDSFEPRPDRCIYGAWEILPY